MSNQQPENEPSLDINHFLTQRRIKLTDWRRNERAYPTHFRRDHYAKQLNDIYDSKEEAE